MNKFKYGDEVIMKDRRLKYRLGKVLGSVPGGYEVLMEDGSIRYEDHTTIELRYEEEVEPPEGDELIRRLRIICTETEMTGGLYQIESLLKDLIRDLGGER